MYFSYAAHNFYIQSCLHRTRFEMYESSLMRAYIAGIDREVAYAQIDDGIGKEDSFKTHTLQTIFNRLITLKFLLSFVSSFEQ